MLFLTTHLPLTSEGGLARALAPLVAFCELFEPHPEPAVLLRGGHGGPTLCMPAVAAVEARLFDHPELAVGVRVALSEDLAGTSMLVSPDTSMSAFFEFLADRLYKSHTNEGRAELLAKLVFKKVRSILLYESRRVGFTRRGYPYRDPCDVLRRWGLKPPPDCDCMRTKCETCLVRRWETITTMRKHRTALPPGGASKGSCYQFRPPPQGTVFLAAVHPFGWVRDGRFSRASIW